jgi:hypothetical protein
VGTVNFGEGDNAALWTGSAASHVNLHPSGAVRSEALNASGTHQVGLVVTSAGGNAVLWSGTAESWVNLNPAGATNGVAWDVLGNFQVGYVGLNGAFRASIWEGTAESWVDLSQFLPAGTLISEATGISSDGVNIYVSGHGFVNGSSQAFVWTRPVPSPGAIGVVMGVGLLGMRRRRV